MADIQFPNTLLGPATFEATVVDNNGPPTSVMEAGLEFKVETKWDLDALTALLLGGEWEVSVYVESIGPGPEQRVASAVVPVTGATAYQQTLVVPAGTLPNDPPPPQFSGVYKVVTVLTHRNFGQRSNVAAIVEAPLMRIA